MKTYRCHKIVQAARIAALHVGTLGDGLITPDDHDDQTLIEVSAAWLRQHDPQVGGYYVVYADGYTSYSPREAFESGYTEIPKEPADGNSSN